jgi:hypothetical protein
MGKIVRAGAGAGIFDKPDLEPDKNGPAPQHCFFAPEVIDTECFPQKLFQTLIFSLI